jgi:hypothetical protein
MKNYVNKKELAEAAQFGIPAPSEIKSNIQSCDRWATRALLAVFAMQEADEARDEHTYHENKVGFSKFDAEFLTSVAKQAKKGRTLSDKQMVFVRKKMGKYAKQLFWLSLDRSRKENNDA